MRCVALGIVGISLLVAGCATPHVGTRTQEQSQFVSVLTFSSQSSSTELEQAYRFSAKLAGKPRDARAWQDQMDFEREFPQGMAVAEVMRSIQVELNELFVYQERGAQWTNSILGAAWTTSLMIGEGVEIREAHLVPLDAMSPARIQMSLGGMVTSTAAASRSKSEQSLPGQPMLGQSIEDLITLAPVASITSWDPAPEQEHDWQSGRGLDPWLIPDREYVERRRENTLLVGFIQLSFWVLGTKARS
jgi:hypothetical protein